MRGLLTCFFLAAVLPALGEVAPIPESEQGPLASKIIDAYHGPRPADPPKKLHVFYFTPSDREAPANHQQRVDAILEDIRAFYRDGMQRLGFGPKTFALARDANAKLIIPVVKGAQPEAAYPRSHEDRMTGDPVVGGKVTKECEPALKDNGISLDNETVLILCNLATYDPKGGTGPAGQVVPTFNHHSPYAGMSWPKGGLCWAADWAEQDTKYLSTEGPQLYNFEFGNMSLGHLTTVMLGGIAHEMGHAFGLPHCGERWDEKKLGTSIMGAGNHTYREELRHEGKGSFLTMASAMRLASRPLFNGSTTGMDVPGKIEEWHLSLSTNITRSDLAGRPAAMRLEGTIKGSPPVYGVIAYFDSVHDGGYRAPTATSVPDAQGQFAIEISDLGPCEDGNLRVEICHANGAVSERRIRFRVTREHRADLAQYELRRPLEPLAQAVLKNDRAIATQELQKLEQSNAAESLKLVARKLVATLDTKDQTTPAKVSDRLKELPVGDALAEHAEVGWLKPSANRIPAGDQVDSPLLDSGNIYPTGLFAHSPSQYVYDLGGKWKRLKGEGGLHSEFQTCAAGVKFVIKGDGKELFRSNVIRDAKKTVYDVDVARVNRLELIVESAQNQNGCNWALWLEPMLFR
jgi:hypothetical protein